MYEIEEIQMKSDLICWYDRGNLKNRNEGFQPVVNGEKRS